MEGYHLARATSKAVIKFLFEEIICCHGIWGECVKDGGLENKDIVQDLLTIFGIKDVTISVYNAPVNWIIKGGHQPIVDIILKLCKGNLKKMA